MTSASLEANDQFFGDVTIDIADRHASRTIVDHILRSSGRDSQGIRRADWKPFDHVLENQNDRPACDPKADDNFISSISV